MFFARLQKHARGIVGGSVLLGVAGLILSQTLFTPKYEVLYSGSVSAAFCQSAERGGACTFVYTLSVGNTGTMPQEAMRIAWPLDMQSWSLDTQVSDIVASARPTAQPSIRPVLASGGTAYEIGGLAPNTVVDIKIRCLVCTAAQLEAMRHSPPSVESRGTVVQSDPRVSALRRALTNFLRLFGLFR